MIELWFTFTYSTSANSGQNAHDQSCPSSVLVQISSRVCNFSSPDSNCTEPGKKLDFSLKIESSKNLKIKKNRIFEHENLKKTPVVQLSGLFGAKSFGPNCTTDV